MLRAMDSAVAGLRAHQNKLDVIGHNIANVNTYGYKSQSYSFKEAMYQTSSASTGGTADAGGTNAAQYGYGTMMGSISTDMSASTPTYVGGFNASIDGEGFFITFAAKDTAGTGVATTTEALKAGGAAFTRVGMFSIDSNGYMVDSNGNFVYGFKPEYVDGKATYPEDAAMFALRAPTVVTVAANGDVESTSSDYTSEVYQLSSISINSLGEVTATIKAIPDGGDEKAVDKVVTLGKVAIASFQNPNGLTKSGSIYYSASTGDNSGAASATIPGGATSTLMTGYVEASNVDLAKEFSDMITTQRGFQANSKIITVSDEILAELINMKR